MFSLSANISCVPLGKVSQDFSLILGHYLVENTCEFQLLKFKNDALIFVLLVLHLAAKIVSVRVVCVSKQGWLCFCYQGASGARESSGPEDGGGAGGQGEGEEGAGAEEAGAGGEAETGEEDTPTSHPLLVR